ncbi:TolC family protein [Mucilaginibacter sp. P19]|uniref:Outer membrane protein TolC n=1 Tax=Mucilaginibacter gossypii TaxID=551996 RepID=A0A1G8D5K7_9SPHI|nr:TolC family protein [Mucilaginibacter gossypii]SDH52794.1 Outer membrane protein TolC [Mucilaginibacter gossypii]
MNYKILWLLVLAWPLKTAAQSNWDLKTCIEYGLKNNRSNAVYANEKLIADAKAKEALAAYLPSIGITSTLDNNLMVQETVIPAGIFGPKDIRVAFTKKFNANQVARLDQTLYDQSLLTGLKANKYNRQQANLNQQKNDETIIYNISNAYAQVFIYREQLGMLHDNLNTYNRQMELTGFQVKKGVRLQKDLDKVTVDYNNTRSQIAVAESNLDLANNQLKYEMGYPMDSNFAVDSTGANVFQNIAPLLTENSSFSAVNRTDYRLSQINLQLLEIDQQRIKAGALPKLTAYAQYGAVGFGDQLGPAYNTLSPYSAIGLKLTIPLFDFFKRSAQYKQAAYKSLNAKENLKIDEDKYRLGFANARTKLLKEQSNVENSQRNIELAKSVFNTTNLQYQKGTTDLTDWLNAQNSLKEAQNNYLNGLYTLFQSRIELENAGGTLKSFYTGLPAAHEK